MRMKKNGTGGGGALRPPCPAVRVVITAILHGACMASGSKQDRRPLFSGNMMECTVVPLARPIEVTAAMMLLVLFGCANKPAEKHRWLICYERKILFRLKKQAEKYGL
jgi:hypothetical protein